MNVASDTMRERISWLRWPEAAVLVAVLVAFSASFSWLIVSWSRSDYDSWGFLPLLLLVPKLRQLPAKRAAPSSRHLVGVLIVLLVALLCRPLAINVLAATLALVCLHLWLVAFWDYRGRWYLQRQLWIALLCLPVVYWANVLFGNALQQVVARFAAAGLRFYGLPVVADGTLLRFPSLIVAVDTSCSGFKLLFAGMLFGLLACPSALGLRQRLIFWLALGGMLVAANVARVMSLTLAHLQLGRPVGELSHQIIGLLCLAMVCAACLLLLRRFRRSTPLQQTTSDPAARAPLNDSRHGSRHKIVIAAIVGCAVASLLLGHAERPEPARSLPSLPAAIDDEPGVLRQPSASEERLAAAPHVSLLRRDFGTTQVALVTTDSSIKELHPPQACLEADDFEIVDGQRQSLTDGQCLTTLRVRRRSSEQIQHYTYGFFSHASGRVGCSFWRRFAHAVWDQLAGNQHRWSTLQVMDASSGRARSVALSVLKHLEHTSVARRKK